MTLLNVDYDKLNPDWIDPNSPLKIPRNPLHYKAHKLQLLLDRLEVQATKNAAQFNSKNYIDALNEWERVIDLIKSGALTDDKVLGSRKLDKDGNESPEGELGEAVTDLLDNGVSADNPAAG